MNRSFWMTLLFAALTVSLQAQVPLSKHVYIVAEENRSYESLVGSTNMPYLNSLINKGALATHFYANRHGSISDYFLLTSGQVVTTNDNTTATYNVDNMVRRLLQQGLTYKAYAESLPYAGYTGLYNPPTAYMKRHVPFPYYTDMGNSSTELQKLVPLTQFDNDVRNGNEPNFGFITPDGSNDLHDCSQGLAACEQRADAWLKTHIAPLLGRPEFQPGGDGLLIIWTDEADLSTDNRCAATVYTGCGGHILVTLYGPKVKAGFKSNVTYHHQSMLRTMLEALGVTSNFPGSANSVLSTLDLFVASTSIIGVESPANNATVTSPLHVFAIANGPKPIVTMKVYVDNVLKSTASANFANANISVIPGPHSVVIQSVDNGGGTFKRSLNVTAQ